jgi:hypothetical protein
MAAPYRVKSGNLAFLLADSFVMRYSDCDIWKRSLFDQKENGNDTEFSKRAADGYSFDAHHAVRDIRRDKCFSTASLPKTSS